MKDSDNWQTPQDLFEVLDGGGFYQGIEFKGFNFDIDLCATRENSKCNHLCWDFLHSLTGSKDSNCIGTIYDDVEVGLIKTGFMNPPYSNPKPFIEKAWEHSKIMKIVCLVKCDPSTRWWSVFWDYDKDCGKPGASVRFFPKRIKFDPPQQLIDSGDVYKICNKWAKKCDLCNGSKKRIYGEYSEQKGGEYYLENCYHCKGKGYKELSGPTFPIALIIMDRRNV